MYKYIHTFCGFFKLVLSITALIIAYRNYNDLISLVFVALYASAIKDFNEIYERRIYHGT